jgi:hypothetical protein
VRTEPLTVPVGKTARRVIVAHNLRESQVGEGGPVGQVVAHYVFHLAGGEQIRVPIRERFEIAMGPPGWGQAPFLAVPDQKNSLMPRYEGRWDATGQRQTEAVQGWPRAYYLWAWENPCPNRTIESLEIVPEGPTFLVAAITLGHLDEDPFCRAVKREVKITRNPSPFVISL